MKKKIFLLLSIVIILSACSYNRPVCATEHPVGSKTGKFTQIAMFRYMPSETDAVAIQEAAKNGGITKISTVDYIVTYYLFTTKYETIVTGE